MMNGHQVLEKYFGYTTFRTGQAELIQEVLNGHDVVGIMPTGGGKSLCYQIPALILEGLTLVISPLISLMKDQVNGLNQMGIPSAYLNSSLSSYEQDFVYEEALAGHYKLLYVAPEQLMTPRFQRLTENLRIPFVSVDEAHCVSQWGQDFRPSYLEIAPFLASLKERPVLGAYTATATEKVQEDLIQRLEMQAPFLVTTGFDRKNLAFKVATPRDKFTYVKTFLSEHVNESGIIYCLTRKEVEHVCQEINDAQLGVVATRYHAGLSAAERQKNQDAFVMDQAPVMVATNAFGMGIDKSNVAFVIHYNMPKNLENYYQEAGRAGRDGSPAECVLLYSGQDVRTNQFLIDKGQQNENMSQDEFQAFRRHELERLKQMTFYCTTQRCLRQFILQYFGEKVPDYCGNCSNCLTKFEKKDITIDAQKILSCVKRMGERFGAALVVQVLRGSREERVLRNHFDQLPTYGLLKEKSQLQVRQMVNLLVERGYLAATEDEYPVLRLTAAALPVLKGQQEIEMFMAISQEPAASTSAKRQTDRTLSGSYSEELFQKLRVLRSDLASAASLPAFVIFSDVALKEMAQVKPVTKTAFLDITGVGQVKLEKYGETFIKVIKEFKATEGDLDAETVTTADENTSDD